jgi:quercetin dioxygenase-like cupin family protein
MLVITESDEHTTTTPNGAMTALATPSLGTAELSTWRVRMPAGARGPVHSVDREQLWLPVDGTFEITIDGAAHTAVAGQVAIIPAGVVRQIRPVDGPAEAVVCMAAGGVASVPGETATRPLPWAQ